MYDTFERNIIFQFYLKYNIILMSKQFKKDFDSLKPVDYINSFLVEKGIRDAYLIQNFESNTDVVESRIAEIQTIFPKLKILKTGNYYFLSLKQLKKVDVETDEKISPILRFSCDVKYTDLDRTMETIGYHINVFLKGIEEPLNIISYVCQTTSTIRDAEQLVSDIKKVLMDDINLKKIVLKVELDVVVDMPILSFIPKLMDPKYKFNKEEIEGLNNIIFNIMNSSYEKIIDNIDYDNLIHRGIMLVYITEHEHDILEPFYPLQSSGHMEEITQIEDKKCDLMEKILVDSKKSIRQFRPGVGRRSKKKI